MKTYPAARFLLLVVAFFLITAVSCTALRREPGLPEPTPGEVQAPAPDEPGEPEDFEAEDTDARPADRGVVAAAVVNVRSGPNINYEILGQLSKGDSVELRGSRFGWIEIAPPAGFKGWVHSDYVDLPAPFEPGKPAEGVVKASRLNIRALPGTEYSVIAQVSMNDSVTVIDREGDWLGIEISRLASAWVHSQHIEPAD